LKPDAKQIRDCLAGLAKQDWVKRSERRWWPHFIFHYTDIRNAATILQDGYLYSRKRLQNSDRSIVSSGSPRILAGTNTAIKDCVRLYFRPKTPTQYHAEGIRSRATLSASKFPDAHCPVPVFFLFDSAELLARDDCWFSNGNLSSPKAQVLSTATELEQLLWRKVYHNTSLFGRSTTEKTDIVFRRNAEVIVPHKLDLHPLRYVYCRSDAEKETLLHLLSADLRNKYQAKVVATPRSDLFFRQHTFIEAVRLSATAAHFHFSPETQSPGPFHLRVDFESASLRCSPEAKEFKIDKPYNYEWGLPRPVTSYTIRLFLDDHLAYANTYKKTDTPF